MEISGITGDAQVPPSGYSQYSVPEKPVETQAPETPASQAPEQAPGDGSGQVVDILA